MKNSGGTDSQSEQSHVWVATSQTIKAMSMRDLALQESVSTAQYPLTRRNFLTQLFQMLNQPYGLGGDRGGVDSARLLVNALEPFGLNVPRHAEHQSHMGTFSIDVSDIQDPKERLNIFNAAFKLSLIHI